MKPTSRWLFNGLTALSLLLCVATVVIEVRSYWIYDRVTRQTDDTISGFFTGVGRLRAIWHKSYTSVGRVVGIHSWQWKHAPVTTENNWFFKTADTIMGRLGFQFYHFEGRGEFVGENDYGIFVPLWFIAMIFCVLPMVRIPRTLRRRFRLRSCLCLTCGYDVRASPRRCPECGTEIAPKTIAIST